MSEEETIEVSGPRRILGRVVRIVRFGRSYGTLRAVYRVIRGVCYSWGLGTRLHFSIAEVFGASASELKSSQQIPSVFTVRRAEEQDLSGLESYFSNSQVVRDRLRRGDICLVALVSGQIGAAVWLALGPKKYYEDWSELRCVFRFPAGACWVYNGRATVFGAWGGVAMSLSQHLERLGVSTVFTQVDHANTVSLQCTKSLGFRPIGRICRLTVARFSLCIYRTHKGRWRPLPGRIGNLELLNRLHDFESHG